MTRPQSSSPPLHRDTPHHSKKKQSLAIAITYAIWHTIAGGLGSTDFCRDGDWWRKHVAHEHRVFQGTRPITAGHRAYGETSERRNPMPPHTVPGGNISNPPDLTTLPTTTTMQKLNWCIAFIRYQERGPQDKGQGDQMDIEDRSLRGHHLPYPHLSSCPSLHQSATKPKQNSISQPHHIPANQIAAPPPSHTATAHANGHTSASSGTGAGAGSAVTSYVDGAGGT